VTGNPRIPPPWTRHLWTIVPLGIAVLLFFTFRLYRSAYFWVDDFNSIHWASVTTNWKMLEGLLNPASHFFRPAGMLFYWLGWRSFGMNERGFHIVAWVFHAMNTGLVYFVLKRITRSPSGAAVGATLFASQAVFSDIYWAFGDIFELVSGLFFFLGIYLWASESRSWKKAAVATIVFVFAMKGKEMAITLPAIWLGYDLIVRSRARLQNAMQIVLPGSIGAYYAIVALGGTSGTPVDAVYYMDIRGVILGQGMAYYLNELFQTHFLWQMWAAAFVVLAILLAALKAREAFFFTGYVLITFSPVIFLVNHRFAFYWYIPFLGVCGLAAVLVRWLSGVAETRIPSPYREIAACIAFIVFCRSMFFVTKEGVAGSRYLQQRIESEYRGFVSGLKSLPAPPQNEILYFSKGAVPSFFDEALLDESIQLTLGRPDLHARQVEEFPPDSKYRLSFRDWRLVMMPVSQ
jgi:hypothetical protein